MSWFVGSRTEAGGPSTPRRHSFLDRLPAIRRNRQAFDSNRATADAEGSRAEVKETDFPITGELEEASISSQVVPPIMNVTHGIDFSPPVVFGGPEEQGLSAIQRANLYMEKWEKMRVCHEEHYPAALPVIDKNLERWRAHRATLEDNEENNRVGDPKKREQIVLDRIAVLEKELGNAKFGPEIENITGAVAAYKSGEIPYSDQYTLIWGGKVVDRAATYAEFTVDRQKRLDRYAELYGPHWLWWESPLKLKPHERPRLNLCAKLIRDQNPTGMGGFWINETFWKRAGWVRRIAQVEGLFHHLQHLESPQQRVNCGDEAPKITLRMVLDSGATYPTLHPHDLEAMGIDLYNYGAQSIEQCETANGLSIGRVYELHVNIVDHNNNSLVDPEYPVWPAYGRYLGGLCPVFMLGCDGPEALVTNCDAEGYTTCQRLSGILPFLCCYTTTTPCLNTMFVGEDRNDVMGVHKTPGQRRWEMGMPSDPPEGDHWETKYGNPAITFNHRNGMIVNIDVARNKSKTVWYPGTSNERVVMWDPAAESEKLDEARRKRALEDHENMPTNMGNLSLQD